MIPYSNFKIWRVPHVARSRFCYERLNIFLVRATGSLKGSLSDFEAAIFCKAKPCAVHICTVLGKSLVYHVLGGVVIWNLSVYKFWYFFCSLWYFYGLKFIVFDARCKRRQPSFCNQDGNMAEIWRIFTVRVRLAQYVKNLERNGCSYFTDHILDISCCHSSRFYQKVWSTFSGVSNNLWHVSNNVPADGAEAQSTGRVVFPWWYWSINALLYNGI